MAELIVHNPPRVALKASGYTGSPEGNIELTENNKTYDVSDFATATTSIPEPPEPTGTKEIIENGIHDVKEYAFANVKVPEPSGTITLDENNRSYDVTDYAAADVAIPEEEKTVTPSTTRQEVTPDNGLLSKVTVLPAPLEERAVTPAIVQQVVTPTAPNIGLSSVTVEEIPESAKNFNLDLWIRGELTDVITTATVIATSVFRGTSIRNITMPNVVVISVDAFYSCSSLLLSELPDSITTILASGFRDCSKITITKLPNQIQRIGASAFYRCTSIPYLDVSDIENIPFLDNANAFGNTTFPFYFSNQMQLDSWTAATNWSALASRFQIKPSGV